jgi:dihydrofolate reductase
MPETRQSPHVPVTSGFQNPTGPKGLQNSWWLIYCLSRRWIGWTGASSHGRKTLDAALQMGGSFGGASMTTHYYVFSRSQPSGERDGVVFVNESPETFIAGLRKREGKDIWPMGGGKLARGFLEADLVDELYLGVVPALIGQALPAFPSGFPQREFSLIENTSYSKRLIALKCKRVKRESWTPSATCTPAPRTRRS